ncbi:Eae-like protein [Atlantibacter sp.]|uniref:Eae-like protein n=1 Tax=Atlantibacter sp. TaxID=1903473 RepID=UPI0028AD9C0B|nr:Eae-like protein [Atlantibacter sp.]
MRLTIKQLIHAAHQAARYLPKASAQLMRDLAERLDTTQSALCESLKIRDALAAENLALKEAMKNGVVEPHQMTSRGVSVGVKNVIVNREIKTPSTDAFLAEVRAHGRTQGIYFVANRMLAAWEHGFIECPESEVIDVARMLLSSVEMLPDAEEEDFEREFADEMMGVLTDSLRGNSNGGTL